MRGGIKDDRGLVFFKEIFDLTLIANASDKSKQVQCGIFAAKLLLDLVCVVFVNIEDDQLSRTLGGDLTAKLASDRSAAARDEDDLVLKVTHNFV